MYKEKLIALLEALEAQNIEELIEQPAEMILKVGEMIKNAAKIVRYFPAASQPKESSGQGNKCGCQHQGQWACNHNERGICMYAAHS